ncbi:MAG: hypothetical protein HQK79_02210 [Desulfobacterales bacterium]|nr:hypothetical protein [Desulfobacterales bacterium]MBF0398227.1 hypothetical protein [Desulfobacterales bacterium]
MNATELLKEWQDGIKKALLSKTHIINITEEPMSANSSLRIRTAISAGILQVCKSTSAVPECYEDVIKKVGKKNVKIRTKVPCPSYFSSCSNT